MHEETKDGILICCFSAIAIIIAVILIWGGAAIYRDYSVWAQGKEGQAELAKADWNRQITVREAKAKEESSALLAQAEVRRAIGVAKANKIIGDSLKKNEAYLRYLWINNLHEGKNQVIYVPTETNLPILEAGRFHKKNG
ncbi:MAG: membrane protease subunit [Candidatus Heimdallarchaeaceae archaeon]